MEKISPQPGEIEEVLVPYFAEEFETDPGEIIPSAVIHTTLRLDSLDYVDIAVTIERKFGVRLRPADFVEIRTFSDLYARILGKSGC